MGPNHEVTPLEAPWRNGKTGYAGKDGKEDCCEMTEDGPEARTLKDFEEDCDAVNQAKASKNNNSRYSAYQRVLGRNFPQMENAVLECGGADLGVVSRQQTGELAASLALDQKRRWKRALYHAAKHQKRRTGMLENPSGFRRSFHDDDETAHEHTSSHWSTQNLDAAPQETEKCHDDTRKRVDEPVSPQDEVSTVSPVHFDSEPKDDEIAESVALPEEPT